MSHLGQLVLAVGAARAADHDQDGPGQVGATVAAPAAVGVQMGQGVDGHGRALEGLDPADEEDDRVVGRQTRRPAGPGPGRPG